MQNFEPRVDNLQVNVNPKPDQNEFEVNVLFDIIGQEFPAQTLHSYYKQQDNAFHKIHKFRL